MRQKSRFFSLIGSALVLAAFSMTSVGGTSTAHAQAAASAKKPDAQTKKAARTAYGDGQKAFEAGDYTGAYERFKEANDLIPAPHAEYWMALSLDRQGEEKLEETIAAYEAFLANPEAEKVGEEQVASARTRLDELKTKLPGKLNIVTEPTGAAVMIDGAPVEGTAPMVQELSPGMHKISVTLEGYESQEIEVEVKPGEQVEQTIQLVELPPPVEAAPPPPPPPPPAPAPPPPERSMVPAYVTLGIAGAGLVTGTIFGIMALNAKSDFNDDPTTDTADEVERNALIADMSFGIAITLGVTGIVLLTSDESADEATASVKRDRLVVAPYVGKTGGGAAASYSF